MNMTDAKTIQIWISALEDQTDRMTAWEIDFLENVSDVFDNGGTLSDRRIETLTDKQVDTLKGIYEKYY